MAKQIIITASWWLTAKAMLLRTFHVLLRIQSNSADQRGSQLITPQNCKISKNPLPLTFCPPRSSILQHIWERLHFKRQKEDNIVAENLFSVHLRAYQQCELCQCIKLYQYSQIKLYKNIHIENNKFKRI